MNILIKIIFIFLRSVIFESRFRSWLEYIVDGSNFQIFSLFYDMWILALSDVYIIYITFIKSYNGTSIQFLYGMSMLNWGQVILSFQTNLCNLYNYQQKTDRYFFGLFLETVLMKIFYYIYGTFMDISFIRQL